MAHVFLAHDQFLDRDVAIKMMPPKYAVDEVGGGRQRWLNLFHREAASTARLQHPGIVVLHDFGIHMAARPAEPDIAFLVLEHVQGVSLAKHMAHQRLSAREVLAWAQQLVDALAHAHEQGVIHRDLKPSNILIEPSGRVKILDFGLALLREPPHRVQPAKASAVSGTPLYMAPEQYLGVPQDARVDVWALGVVIFEMLTGRRPFSTSDEVLSGVYPPLGDDVPDLLHALLADCLQRDASHRPANAGQLAMRFVDHPVPLPAARKAAMSKVRLTRWPDAFCGRHDELDFLVKAQRQGSRLLVITGTGGCGKTRLAHELGVAIQDDFATTVFCELSTVSDLDGLIFQVARALGLDQGMADPSAQLSKALSEGGRKLFILDNFEQLVAHAAATIGVWLAAAPAVSFVVTSRQRLSLPSEVVLRLHRLPLPEDETSQRAQASPAVQLFVRRARAKMPAVALHDRNRATVVALVRMLDGLPLAIELAAARAHMMTPAQMLARMNHRLTLLKRQQHPLNARHTTLQRTPEGPWELLEPWEQASLAQLSVFTGGIWHEAAAAVLDLGACPGAPQVELVLASLAGKRPPSFLGHSCLGGAWGTRRALRWSVRACCVA